MQPGEQEENVPVANLVNKRIAAVVQALERAEAKPTDPKELRWTVRTITTTLRVLGVAEEKRKAIIRDWCQRVGVRLSESRLRDILDRVTVTGRDDHWLGRSSWGRLMNNLGVKKPPHIPG